MRSRSSKRPRDVNQLAHFIVGLATGDITEIRTDDGKNAAAVALGRLGGKKGGTARAKSLTADQRREIARAAATARWKKERDE